MKPHETEEYKLLNHWFSSNDSNSIVKGERRNSWSEDSKQLAVMTKWHAADEDGKEAMRSVWRAQIVERKEREEARKVAEQDAAKSAVLAAIVLEKKLLAAPSAFQDIPGLELSKLFAGTYPLPEFWEKHWTAEEKDRTRHMLANIGLGIRKVETPANLLEKSITRYELAPRTKNASEKLMELPPLPSGKNWQKMSDDEREIKLEDDKDTFKAAGGTTSEIRGISARHIYEVCYCSRRDSEGLSSQFRSQGVLPAGTKLQSGFIAKTGISTVEELAELPLNMVKALFLAYSSGSVARYWEGRSNASDMAEEMRVWASEGFKPSRAPFFVNI